MRRALIHALFPAGLAKRNGVICRETPTGSDDRRRNMRATICANFAATLSRSNGVGVNLFQPIPKPAVNDLPLITNPTEIEKVRPFIL